MPTKSELDRQHAQTVKRLLLAESAASKLIKTPVQNATARVQASVSLSSQNQRHAVLSAIQHHGPQLREEMRGAVLGARQRARDLGREQLTSDLVPVKRWAAENFRKPPPDPGFIPHAATLDAFEADRVASAVHSVWGSALLNGFNGWERKGGTGSIVKALAVDRILQPRLNVHAATQAASAYADERQSYWDNLAEQQAPSDGGGFFGIGGQANDDGDNYGPALFHVWSAVLDERTCEDCASLDGSIVPIDEDFEAGADTPLHPSCRCVILTTFDEDALDGTDNRQAVGDQIRNATLPSLMRQF